MKILHITTIRSGSTGRTATDLKSILIQKGEQYKIAFSEQDSRPLDGDILIGNSLDHKVHAFLSRLLGLQGYFSYLATRKFLKQVKHYQPDIVQLGNLHANYINLPLLFRFLSKEKIPVVMILHDCWFFTGKCTHFTARSCDKWKQQCKHCPAKERDNESWFFDFSKKMFEDRRKWYSKLISLTVIAVSDWERRLAEQSPLFAKANVTRIYNWIDVDTFKPATSDEKERVRLKYGLSKKIKYVISVSARWSATTSKSKDAMALAAILPSDYRLILVGRGEEHVFSEYVMRIPYTSNPSELAALYSLSEAYLHFSVEDTFGKVIAESMACETVPIVFDSTACGETAGPFGIAVAPHDVKAMLRSIPMAEDQERRKKVREYALSNYYKPSNIEKYWGGVYKPIIQQVIE